MNNVEETLMMIKKSLLEVVEYHNVNIIFGVCAIYLL